MNTIIKQTGTIKLLDESGGAAIEWQLLNAWPTEIIGTDLKSGSKEVAGDTMEIAH